MNENTPALRKVMGFGDVVLFLILAVLSPRWIANAAAAGPGSLTVWLLAALTFFVPLALTVVDLTARYPAEGGIYVWTREGLGDFAGFITGWCYWTSNLFYFPSLLYFGAACALYAGGHSWLTWLTNPWYFIAMSLAGLALGTWLNLIGLEVGKWLHNLGSWATILPLAVLFGCGIWVLARSGSATAFHARDFVPGLQLKDILFWSTIAFAFAGFESASLMAGEIRDAARVVPRAIVVGGIAIAAIYVAGTAAVLFVMTPDKISSINGFMEATAASTAAAGVGFLLPPMALLVAGSMFAAVGAWLAATARIPFVAGIDNFLPPAFARLHPKWGTPYVAILTQAVLAGLFAILGQAGTTVRSAYDVLVSLAIVSYFIPYLLMFIAAIALPGKSRIAGGRPVAVGVAAVGFVVTAVSLVLALLPSDTEPHPALAVTKVLGGTVALVAVGSILYWRGKMRGGAIR